MKNENALLRIMQLANEAKGEKSRLSFDKLKSLLTAEMTFSKIAKGDYITTEDMTGKKVYYVITGSYLMMRESQKGINNILTRQRAPQFIGIDRAILSEDCLFANVLALEECCVLKIESSYFVENVKNSAEFSFEIAKMLCERLVKTSYRTDQILFYTTAEKLMIYIVKYWNEYHGMEDRCVVDVKNTFIADDMGVSTRSLYRAIKKLKDENLVTVVKGNIRVTSEQVVKMKELCKDFWIINQPVP